MPAVSTGGIAIPADAEQGALSARVRGRGGRRGTAGPLNPSLWAGRPLLGGALAGGTAVNVGPVPAPCDPIQGGRVQGPAVGCVLSAACPSPARSGRGGGGSGWDGCCVEFDFSWPAWGKLVSPGTSGIIYREPANQTQPSNLTFPSPRKFLQLGATAR